MSEVNYLFPEKGLAAFALSIAEFNVLNVLLNVNCYKISFVKAHAVFVHNMLQLILTSAATLNAFIPLHGLQNFASPVCNTFLQSCVVAANHNSCSVGTTRHNSTVGSSSTPGNMITTGSSS